MSARRGRYWGDRGISGGFSRAERERFHNLLLLAAESPFAGERDNAIDAATRLAAKYGMSLDEAARAPEDPPAAAPAPQPPPRPPFNSPFAAPFAAHAAHAAHAHVGENFINADKARREAALKDAVARGLDADLRRAAETRPRRARASGAKRGKVSHATVLLRETSLPLQEVADLCGLDIYQVVGMKLKMRVSA